MSSSYDGCGSDISLMHALDCHNGGLVTQHRSNEVRDTSGDLAYRDVNCEPIVQEGGDGVPPMMNKVAVLTHDAERKLISHMVTVTDLVHFV